MKTKLILTLCSILFFPLMATSGAEPMIVLDYSHSLRIPNSKVSIKVDGAGTVLLSTTTRGKAAKTQKLRLAKSETKNLRNLLAGVDWDTAQKDKVSGLDGTRVMITYGDKKLSLWTPDYNTKKRGLEKLQKAIEQLFKIAGLDAKGMPAPTKTKN